MAIRILYDPSKENKQAYSVQEQPPQPQQEQGFLSQLGGSLGNIGLSVAKGAANIPAFALDVGRSVASKIPAPYVDTETGEIKTTRPGVGPTESASELLSKGFSKAREAIPKPIGFGGEEFLNKVAEAVPSFYLPGGGFKAAITRATSSETGKRIAKELGGKELAQFVGSVAGGAVASGLLSHGHLKDIESQKYKAFTSSVPEKAMTKIPTAEKANSDLLKSRILPEVSEWLSKNLKPIESLLKRGVGKTLDVFEDLKLLNKIKRSSMSSLSKEAKKEATYAINKITNALKEDIAKTPNIDSKSFLEGHNLSWARAHSNLLGKLFNLAKSSYGQVATGAATLGAVAKPLAAKAVASTGTLPVGLGALGVRGLVEPALLAARNPTARQYFSQQAIPKTLAGILGSLKTGT